MDLNEILKIALKGGASDIHLKSGLPPMFRLDGALVPLKNGERMMPEEIQKMAVAIMNPLQKQRFEETREVDLAYGIAGLGRFRVNVFQQRGTVGIVFRVIPFGVKSIEQLHLPKVIEKISMENRGLVLVTGTTGSGKSVCINSIITSLLMTQRPDWCKLILVDPKMVEMAHFKEVPHLMCPIVTDLKRAESILDWAVTKMDERYEQLNEAGVRNIAAFNALDREAIYERLQPTTEEERKAREPIWRERMAEWVDKPWFWMELRDNLRAVLEPLAAFDPEKANDIDLTSH